MIERELNGLGELEQFVKDGYAVVDCYGDFCVACVMLAPVFAEAAVNMAGISFGKINVTVHVEAAEKFGIEALPTILFFRDGQEVHRVIGSLDPQDLKKELSVLLYR